jgi:teichoic acid transport system permease protein
MAAPHVGADSAAPGRGRRYSSTVHVFEPSTAELPALRPYLRDLVARRQFIAEKARADIRGPRATTAVGELWALLDPFFLAAIYLFVFTIIRGRVETQYVTMIIFNVFLFNYTRIAISDGGRSVTRSAGLVLNSTFPRALLPITTVYKGLLETMPALGVYALLHVVLGAPIGQGVFLLPLLFLIQTAMNFGLALLLAPAVVIVRDMANLLTYILRLLTFMTPIIWPVDALEPGLRLVLSWNPLFALFASYQTIIVGEMPSAGLVIQSIFWAIVLLIIGSTVFLRHERSFALHL